MFQGRNFEARNQNSEVHAYKMHAYEMDVPRDARHEICGQFWWVEVPSYIDTFWPYYRHTVVGKRPYRSPYWPPKLLRRPKLQPKLRL